MNVVFRTDASLTIGQGHVMRCLTLATALQGDDIQCTFLCREHLGNLCGLIEERGFVVHRLPVSELHDDSLLGATWGEDVEQTRAALSGLNPRWLVVDHYSLDQRWEECIQASVGRILTIDDLANRPHSADLLLDQNLYADMHMRYGGLTKANSRQLLGPDYAMLRQEFIDIRKNLGLRDGHVRRMLIFFGGSDLTNATGKALDAISMLAPSDMALDVVVGETNPHKESLIARCAAMPAVDLHCQVSNMGELMVGADLSLGAGGATTWERCATGLPTLVVSVADNQIAIAKGVDQVNGHRYLGACHDISAALLATAVAEMRNDPATLIKMSKAALSLVDAKGTARVVAAMRNFD